jgi:hypothetical protein
MCQSGNSKKAHEYHGSDVIRSVLVEDDHACSIYDRPKRTLVIVANRQHECQGKCRLSHINKGTVTDTIKRKEIEIKVNMIWSVDA